MPDIFTETNKTSYAQNIKNSLGGMLVGLILFFASFVVLWMNEGNNVKQIYKANYMEKNAIETSIDNIDRQNDNKLIQISGNATTNETLTDNIITIPNAFSLKRTVEMYQWDEDTKTKKEDNLGGSTTETKTYSYEKVWSDREIDSDDFKQSGYKNPKFPIKSQDVYAKSGKLGKFNLTTKQTKAMSDFSKYTNLPQRSEYKIFEDMYYKGYDPLKPSIGDIRISYEYIPTNTNISIIAQQKADDTLADLVLKKTSVYLQQNGLKTKDEMINSFRQGNALTTNIMRLVGWLVMFFGMCMLINPLIVIFKIVPMLEGLVGFLSRGIVFLISLILSLLTIAIAWFAYRPIHSVVLLIVILAIVYVIKTKLKSAKEQTKQE